MDGKLYKYSAIVVCVLILSITSSCQYSKYAIRAMVEGGANPIEAACALEINGESSVSRPECMAYIVQPHANK